MKILELFSGTGSIGKMAEQLGHYVYSIDISDKYYKPTFKGNILNWNYKQFPKGYFDMIWASPPCCAFSSMQFLKKNKTQILENEIKNGLPPLNKTLEIIKYYKPKYYAIENPWQSRMKNYVPNDIPFIKVSYCMYGFSYRKNTRLWTNIPLQPKLCKPSNGCSHSKKHKQKIGSTRINGKGLYSKYNNNKNRFVELLYIKYSIPPQLCKDIIEACDNGTSNKKLLQF